MAQSDAPPRLERRADGWPYCPVCGNDELAVLETPPPPNYTEPLSWYLQRPLHCYWCARVTVAAGAARIETTS